MAFVHIDHLARSTQVNLPLNLIIPDPVRMQGIPVRQRKVLYLLHGLSDDASAWQRNTNIETLANDYGLVVVMPSVGRSFYTDQPTSGMNYFTYIVEEIPQYLADVFDLKPKREDTFMAGLSMGGYGAMKAALLHPELYSAVASFSGVLSLSVLSGHAGAADPRQAEFGALFGDLERLAGGPHDPAVWLQQAAAQAEALPRLFIACGRQDDLYPLSKAFAAACAKLGVLADYHEEDGKHDWYFWNGQIARLLTILLGERP